MFDKPLFQDDILQNLWLFNKTYFITRNWPIWIIGLLTFLAIATLLLRSALQNSSRYQGVFLQQKYTFEKRNWHHWLAFLFMLVSVALSAGYAYYGENTLFENYDLMAINTTRSMRYGLVANFDYIRVIPLASWYLSTLYAITQNIFLIKFFVVLQTFLCVWAIYAFFNYIPVARRLMMSGLLVLLPTYLQTSNIIFPERDMIIALMLGLIFARKYCQTHQAKWAFAFIVFCNVAIYTKETCIIFYFGVLLTSLLYNVIKGNILCKDFLHPLKMIKKFPLEFLIGISLLAYSIIFYLLQNGDNFYLSANNQPLTAQLKTYRFEILLLLIALGAGVYKLRKTPIEVNPLFQDGLLVGALCSAIMVILILKLAPSTPHLADRSYYLLASMLFVVPYLFQHINSKLLLSILSVIMLIYSLYTNINYKRAEVGKYYHEVAEFMNQNSAPNTVTQIFVMEGPYVTKTLWQWIVETWATSYRYYFNDRLMIFKSDVHYLDRTIVSKLELYANIPLIYFPIVPQALPQNGEWLIINKRNQTTKAQNARKAYAANKVFENDLFEVFSPK